MEHLTEFPAFPVSDFALRISGFGFPSSMSSLFDKVIDRTGTGSLKWSRYEGRDILPMWVADMDFASPAPIIAALQRRVEHGCFGYSTAHPGVADAICRHL